VSDKSQRDDAEDKHVGAVIKTLRESYGLSAVELGRLIGKSEQLIHAIENGSRRATPQVRRSIADKLRIPLAALVVDGYEAIREKDDAA
jgi:transcriptional regulator with XRE-family HTH domain